MSTVTYEQIDQLSAQLFEKTVPLTQDPDSIVHLVDGVTETLSQIDWAQPTKNDIRKTQSAAFTLNQLAFAMNSRVSESR